MKSTLTSILLVSVATAMLTTGATAQAAPELYFVEPMICKGTVNLRPPGWASSYDQAGVKITSFRSVRKDCSTANSSATYTTYFEAKTAVVVDKSLEISGWYSSALVKNGDKVTTPNGAWPRPMQLQITSSKISGGVRTDTLEGREAIFNKDGKEYYYDHVCEAIVVDEASTVLNNTTQCANP